MVVTVECAVLTLRPPRRHWLFERECWRHSTYMCRPRLFPPCACKWGRDYTLACRHHHGRGPWLLSDLVAVSCPFSRAIVYRGFRGRRDSASDSETGDDTLNMGGDRLRRRVGTADGGAAPGPGGSMAGGGVSDRDTLGSRRSTGRVRGATGQAGQGSGGRDARYKVSLSNFVEGKVVTACMSHSSSPFQWRGQGRAHMPCCQCGCPPLSCSCSAWIALHVAFVGVLLCRVLVLLGLHFMS